MKRVVVAVALLAGVTAAASSALAAQEASNADPGIGSAAALAAPSCDRERERLKFQSTGAPPCVKPWANGDDNGGATAQGVTKDSIAVVVLWADLPAARAAEGNIIDQATGEPGTEPDAIVDTNEVYEPFHETWGREIEYTFVKAGGLDEASQRADAVKVAAMKPFAVLDYATLYVGGGGLVFESALEGKVPVVFTFPCCGVIPAVERSNPLVANAGEWVGKALVGRKAKWAGDDTLQAEERVFGVVHPAGNFAIDLEVFTKELQKHGGKVTTAVSYPSGTEQLNSPPPEALEQVPTIISRLKSEGVTTVVNFASGLGMSPALTKAATDQDYFPEWVVTGNGYQDIDIVAPPVRPAAAGARVRVALVQPVRRHPGRGCGGRVGLPLVLGHRQGNVLRGRLEPGHLVVHRRAPRGPEADGPVVRARPGRALPTDRRRVLRRDHDPRAELERVRHDATPRERARLVERRHGRTVADRRSLGDRPGEVDVPRRWQALHRRHVPEGRAEVLRRVGVDLGARRGPAGRATAPLSLRRLPERRRGTDRLLERGDVRA